MPQDCSLKLKIENEKWKIFNFVMNNETALLFSDSSAVIFYKILSAFLIYSCKI